MRANRLSWLMVFACAAVSILTLLDAEPGGVRAQGGKKKDEVARYTKQMMARFKAWDLDGDNILDKSELAKAFRGPDAKPFDYQEESPVRQRSRMMYAGLIATSMPLTAANRFQAGLLEVLTPSDPPSKTNYTSLPDYQFLVLAGKSGQTQVTRQEFETWARKYAQLVDGQEEATKRYQQAKARFDKAKTAKGKQQADLDMRRHAQEVQTASTQINAIPLAIRTAMNLKR